MDQVPILQIVELRKNFGGVRAVDGVSFELRPGEAVGIIGPNGSGKTTLVNLITGFVRATSGRVYFKGTDVTGMPPYRRVSLGMARTFQMAKPFYHLPAYKNLVVPLYSARASKLKGGRYGHRGETAIRLLEEVGFDRDSLVPEKPAGSLPHGHLKRLELARCLALEPDLLILDELFSGMTVSEVAGVIPLIERLRREGRTLLMVEHRLKELFQVVNRVIVLNFGRKIAEGTPEEVMQMEHVREAYMGSEVGLGG
ncbi:MAG: ABC transporter ATP-binding protein [Clostridia bacterium]|jgi:branched-chain amino acid transport system ATP-binding protein|nr:ABC transporter ATP-binding protein [Clostridia bacterium]MDH7573099.1 ABC transporter ATP-binding protein [Clostridia bacterium]